MVGVRRHEPIQEDLHRQRLNWTFLLSRVFPMLEVFVMKAIATTSPALLPQLAALHCGVRRIGIHIRLFTSPVFRLSSFGIFLFH